VSSLTAQPLTTIGCFCIITHGKKSGLLDMPKKVAYYTCQKKWLITHAKKSGIIIIAHAQKEGQY
jgi:hypothetical protein